MRNACEMRGQRGVAKGKGDKNIASDERINALWNPTKGRQGTKDGLTLNGEDSVWGRLTLKPTRVICGALDKNNGGMCKYLGVYHNPHVR